VQNRVQLQRERNQGFGAAAMLLRLMQIYSQSKAIAAWAASARARRTSSSRIDPVAPGRGRQTSQCLAGEPARTARSWRILKVLTNSMSHREQWQHPREKDLLLFERADRDISGSEISMGRVRLSSNSPANVEESPSAVR